MNKSLLLHLDTISSPDQIGEALVSLLQPEDTCLHLLNISLSLLIIQRQIIIIDDSRLLLQSLILLHQKFSLLLFEGQIVFELLQHVIIPLLFEVLLSVLIHNEL